jgi:hypothetical protein
MDSLPGGKSPSVLRVSERGDISVSVDGASAFRVVEKTTWNQGTWTDTTGMKHTLSTNGSDVSGTLRFVRRSTDSEFFLVAFGRCDGQTWCDLMVELEATDTGALIHQRYYDPTTPEYGIKGAYQNVVSKTSPQSDTVITVSFVGQALSVKLTPA